jgi:hypothetical protein
LADEVQAFHYPGLRQDQPSRQSEVEAHTIFIQFIQVLGQHYLEDPQFVISEGRLNI